MAPDPAFPPVARLIIATAAATSTTTTRNNACLLLLALPAGPLLAFLGLVLRLGKPPIVALPCSVAATTTGGATTPFRFLAFSAAPAAAAPPPAAAASRGCTGASRLAWRRRGWRPHHLLSIQLSRTYGRPHNRRGRARHLLFSCGLPGCSSHLLLRCWIGQLVQLRQRHLPEVGGRHCRCQGPRSRRLPRDDRPARSVLDNALNELPKSSRPLTWANEND
mmetsp:Transcript_6730/g.18379  ORF Transcript_6730/g.18379 Transcript_6730/m.18379 type:complete len:221 (-) Transcript_6730:12-674(-)